MFQQLMPALRFAVVLTVLTGFIYPALVTGLAKAIFPRQSAGSLVERDGKVIGSQIIGQKFTRPEYFHGRPSAAGDGYDAANSSGSNFGPTNQKLIDRMRADIDAFRRENPGYQGALPADLVTASASGVDPHISPAAAYAQIERVAKARGMQAAELRRLVDEHTEGRQIGFLGEPRVNVLRLNLALDGFANSTP
jgi:K+-transporting ATPase ATPase C chain